MEDLEGFVKQYPKSTDASEALYQLGFYQEIFAKPEDAAKWYKQLVDTFPNARQAEKARGALYRLGLAGKPLTLSGKDIMGGPDVNVSSRDYRGKVVLIHYWSTMGVRWTTDLQALRDIYNKRAGSDFEIIGVCLDDDPAQAKQFISQNKLPWKQIFEKGGLDGRLANQMGITMLPQMIMVDQKGNVSNLNVPVAEVESELAKLIKPVAPTANALRTAPPTR
jgi:peroxiredoxin